MTKAFYIYSRLCRQEGLCVIEGESHGGLLIAVGAGLGMAALDIIGRPWQAMVDMSGGKSIEAWEVAYRCGEVLRPRWLALVGWFSISNPEYLEKAVENTGIYAPTIAYLRPPVVLRPSVMCVAEMDRLKSGLDSLLRHFERPVWEVCQYWDDE